MAHGQGGAEILEGKSPTLSCNHEAPIAFKIRGGCEGQDQQVFVPKSSIRRLTPTEAELLQGFSPGYTKIPYRDKPADQCPDGPRYKALGNSWAVPCAAWIGKRIAEVAARQKK